MSRPKLLFLCQTYPYPPDGGVWIRSFNVLRLLAREFDVTMLAFERAISDSDGFVVDAAEAAGRIAQLADTEVFAIPQRHSRLRFLSDHLRSVITQRPFTRYLYRSAECRARLKQLLETQHFDVVHMDSMDLSDYLPLLDGLPVVCTHHNVESELLRRRSRIEDSRAVGAYMALQARLTLREEREWCARVALNVAVSPDDAAKLREIAPGSDVAVVPNGVDVSYFRPAPTEPGASLVFVGGANWFPNRDALEYFCHDILPLVRREHPDIPVHWVGAAREDDRKRFRDEFGVDLTGYVDDIRPLVHDAACYIVPIRVGGGSRLKILDAWAMGKAVVTTSTGCEGLAAEHEGNALIADTAEAFAAAVSRVVTDAALRRRLGESARHTAQQRYSWDAIGSSMIPLYHRVRRPGHPAKGGP
ncbi:MAG TPA: glycosyltransferase family 4 protein [Longimicrobiales bacterium]